MARNGNRNTYGSDGYESVVVTLETAAGVAVEPLADGGDVNVAEVGGTAVTTGAGAVTAGTQRITHASDDPAVVSLAVLDDWDESDRAKVNPIVGQAGVQGGAGTATALTQRVALATDANAVSTVGTGIMVAATATDAGAGTDDEAITGAAAGLRLMGFSAEETAAGTATVILHNGTGTGDAVTYTFSLAAGESRGEWFGPDGIASAAGIYLERVTGTTRVVVFHKAVA